VLQILVGNLAAKIRFVSKRSQCFASAFQATDLHLNLLERFLPNTQLHLQQLKDVSAELFSVATHAMEP
jgi:hypothetical protein